LCYTGVKLGLSHEKRTLQMVFQNRVLKKIFGPKRMKLTGDCKKLPDMEIRKFTPLQILLQRSYQG